MKVQVYKGILATEYETGMECLGLVLYLAGEAYQIPNPQYNPELPAAGPEFYRSHEGTLFLEKGDRLVLADGRIFTLGNRVAAAKVFKFRLSIYPREYVTERQWLGLFQPERVPATIYRPLRAAK